MYPQTFVVKAQYMEMSIQCLIHMPLLQQGSLHLENKAAMEKTLKIGSELFAYSFYDRSQKDILPVDYTRALDWLKNVVAAGPEAGDPLAPSARRSSRSGRAPLHCAA